jgi:hypothetical protein
LKEKKMIIATWRISTAPDRVREGLEWAKSAMANMKKAGHAPSKWWILRPRTGDTNRFSIAAQFASWAELETQMEKRDADSGFQNLIKERQKTDWYAGIEITINEVFEEG